MKEGNIFLYVFDVHLELQAWDTTSAGCDLNDQLEIIGSKQPEIKTGTAG